MSKLPANRIHHLFVFDTHETHAQRSHCDALTSTSETTCLESRSGFQARHIPATLCSGAGCLPSNDSRVVPVSIHSRIMGMGGIDQRASGISGFFMLACPVPGISELYRKLYLDCKRYAYCQCQCVRSSLTSSLRINMTWMRQSGAVSARSRILIHQVLSWGWARQANAHPEWVSL